MTESTTEETALGAENSNQETIQSKWKLIEKRTISELIGIKPQKLNEQEDETGIVEVMEAMEITNIGVVIKTVVYDGYLPAVSKVFTPGAKINHTERGFELSH